MNKHKTADVMVNFASLRSAYDSTVETLSFPQVSNTFFNIFASSFCAQSLPTLMDH